ncbi:DUF1361 domain-containing protein [Zunongwangia sp. F260]|uniref:DUF1361 domain-containing protein n=1 Tax=Autumnicola lenta TaxID=3075593 RepID=A0ABU3CJ15_9FLAO|nr:DUF1361 domain-containing protein [Zunongwangia sp. F260]MDT0646343.1 DUF1361 domain-containing protein [Zunongwangia sp. F260]
MRLVKYVERNNKLIFSGCFCCSLVILRYLISFDFYYFFLIWNLLLAGIPFLLSQFLETICKNKSTFFVIMGVWLLFLPNSFYVITDLIHLKTSEMKIYDSLMISSFALLCLFLGFSSMQKVSLILSRKFSSLHNFILNSLILFLCSFGIYLGRFLRYNSWDLFNNPFNLVKDCLNFIRFPVQHHYVWVFTFAFGAILTGFYFIFQKMIPQIDEDK